MTTERALCKACLAKAGLTPTADNPARSLMCCSECGKYCAAYHVDECEEKKEAEVLDETA